MEHYTNYNQTSLILSPNKSDKTKAQHLVVIIMAITVISTISMLKEMVIMMDCSVGLMVGRLKI